MKVYIIKPNKIRKIILPAKVYGSYWIDDTDSNGIKRNLISIEAEGNRWKIKSNAEVFLTNGKVMQPYAYLENYKFLQIHNNLEDENILLYASEIELKFTPYDVSNTIDQGITFGSDAKSTISWEYFDKLAFQIKRENHKIYILDNNSKYGIYVNDARVKSRKEVKSGDFIFVAGIQFILLLNVNPKNEVAVYICMGNQNIGKIGINLLSTTLAAPLMTQYVESEEELEFPLYDEGEYFHKMPRFISKIEPLELQVDPPPGKPEAQNNSLLMTIGPMITMSMTSIVTGYSAVNNVLSGNTTLQNAMPSLVISGAMIASVFVWPLFSKIIEKKNSLQNEHKRQKKYSKYIEAKRKKIIEAKKSVALKKKEVKRKLTEEEQSNINDFMKLAGIERK